MVLLSIIVVDIRRGEEGKVDPRRHNVGKVSLKLIHQQLITCPFL